MYLLGLTATPTYTDKKKSGWLKKLFPQGILYQVSPTRLMADRILAQPVFEPSHTTFIPEFDERKYQEWVRDYRDLPEDLITKLAENRELSSTKQIYTITTTTNNKTDKILRHVKISSYTL